MDNQYESAEPRKPNEQQGPIVVGNNHFPPPPPLPCVRCNSENTKFCYYNNYSLKQPRYYCKDCRRYWTQGGSLRTVPVGGGSRRAKRQKLSDGATSSQVSQAPLLQEDEQNNNDGNNNNNGGDAQVAVPTIGDIDPRTLLSSLAYLILTQSPYITPNTTPVLRAIMPLLNYKQSEADVAVSQAQPPNNPSPPIIYQTNTNSVNHNNGYVNNNNGCVNRDNNDNFYNNFPKPWE